jgi:magnesium-transporting ATPase (P-type)
MITGDNALTGANMACQCGISDPSKKTLICNFNPQNHQLIIDEFIYKTNGTEQYKPRKRIPSF